MERNVQKNALVNLVAAVLLFLAALGTAMFVNSAAGLAGAVFLGLGALVALTGWFQMRLEENERAEKLEVDELARSRGETALFAAKESELFPARRAREQFEKFFLPGVSVLLLLLEGGGAWLLWRWLDKAAVADSRAMPALSLFGIYGLLLFLLGRFSVTITRLEDHRLLRPGASFLLAAAYVCVAAALGIAGVVAKIPSADLWVARVLCALLALMAVEGVLTLLLEIYRPRVKGKIARPLYESRLVGLLAQPESLFTAAAQALDYQFGFKVSETWFFQSLLKNLPALLLVQFAVLLLSTCFVFVDAGEQAVLEHFGKPVQPPLAAGAHFKLPWPIDQVYRYRTEQLQSFVIGYTPDAQSESAKVILWTVGHGKEDNYLVASREAATIKTAGETNSANKTPPVSLISVSIPVHFQITNVLDWAYKNGGPADLLQNLATREVVRYLAGMDLNDVMSSARHEAAQILQERIQAAANTRQLGAKITFVGLQDIHPPTTVAGDYEKLVGAAQLAIATNNYAQAYAVQTNAQAVAQAFTATNVAETARLQLETSAFARAALFTNQIPAFEAARSVYKQRLYFQTFADATKESRKYVLLVTNTQNVLIYNLEDKFREDFFNLNVPK